MNKKVLVASAIFIGLTVTGCGDQQSSTSESDADEVKNLPSTLFTSVDVAGHDIDLSNGEYMFNVAGCASCHSSGDDDQKLGGGQEFSTPFGTFRAPNISPDATQGIGSWSETDFANAVMRGVSPDGDLYHPVFPYTSYAKMKLGDVLDVKAHIDTLPAVATPSQDHKVLKIPGGLARWQKNNLKPEAPKEAKNATQRGRYLVEAVGHCQECHTPRTVKLGISQKAGDAFTGERTFDGQFAPRIDKARMAELTNKQEFITGTLEQGKNLAGQPFASEAMIQMHRGLSKMTYADRTSIYAYLAGDDGVSTRELTPACLVKQNFKVVESNEDLETKADQFMAKYCRSCHGPGAAFERIAPTGSMESIMNDPSMIKRASPTKSALLTSVTNGSMPKGGRRPSKAEVQDLEGWLASLKFETIGQDLSDEERRSRESIPSKNVYELAQKDLESLPTSQRRHMRYIDYTHLYNGDVVCESDGSWRRRLTVYHGAFSKMLNSLSYMPAIYRPEEVKGAGGLVQRVDLRKVGWRSNEWNFLMQANPYAVQPTQRNGLSDLSRATNSAIPVARADWFVATAATTDFYNGLLKLPENISELEAKIGFPDINAEIEKGGVIRAGFLEGESNVSGHNRLIERFQMPNGGYYWKSYDFEGSAGAQSLLNRPYGPSGISMPEETEPFEHDGGEMIFSLPNGLQAYYLSLADGTSIKEAPEAIVAFPREQAVAGQSVTIFNGLPCMTCHDQGIITNDDSMRDAITGTTGISLELKEMITALHPTNEDLENVYQADRDKFMTALVELGVASQNEDGEFNNFAVDLGGNKTQEIITYLYGEYNSDLDKARLAAELDLTEAGLDKNLNSIGDPVKMRNILKLLSRLKTTGTVSRKEFEDNYTLLRETLTVDKVVSDLSSAPIVSLPPLDERLTLSMNVSNAEVSVGDAWNFTISSNKDCTLQLFYEQNDGKLIDITGDFPEVVGGNSLKAGVTKTVPIKAFTGAFKASWPLGEETLTAQCRVGGLGSAEVSSKTAIQRAANSHVNVSKGLFIDLSVNALKDRRNHDVVSIPILVTE